MLRSDVEDMLSRWYDGSSRMYKYIRLGPVEYVCFFRLSSEEFKCEKDKSSMDLGILAKEDFIKKLINEELQFVENFRYGRDGTYIKTGGCTCGAWAIPWMANHHYPGCQKPPSSGNSTLF